MSYVGQVCWKTSGTKSISVGHTLETRWDDKWLEVLVQWHHNNSQSWERVANLNFDSVLPQIWVVAFLKADGNLNYENTPAFLYVANELKAQKLATDFLLECCYKEDRYDVDDLSYDELVSYCKDWGIAQVHVQAVPLIQ